MTVETDNVLSAIRRGEDSLPKLRAATGLEYAKLHPILHVLEFEDRSIQRNENADGFDRYQLMPEERPREHAVESTVHTIAPAALARTNAGQVAREMALVQRNAPYCVSCHGLCFVVVDADGRLQWRCRPCNSLFQGSTDFQMAHIDSDPEPEPKMTAMRERDMLGEDEERALANMRVDIDHQIGADEEAALAEMRGGELDEEEARIAEEIDRELAEIEDEEPEVEAQAAAPDLCGCGREDSHRGRCGARREKAQEKAAAAKGSRSTLLKGRPRIDVNLKRFENLLADPNLSIGEVYKAIGMQRNTVYNRRDREPAFRDAYYRGLERRAKAEQNGHAPKIDENITETITAEGQVSENSRNVHSCGFPAVGSKNGTNPETESAQQERAQVVTPDISESKILSIAENSPINDGSKTGNGHEPTAEALLKMIAEKEAQITILQDDIVALRRVADILQT